MSIATMEGKTVPDVTFRIRRGGDLASVDSGELFAGKTVVVFSLPGAFTPTCSTSHLPRYEQLAEELRVRGVDAILCVAVNDPYVMEHWALHEQCEKVMLVPDGNGEFTRAMGMLVDESALGFGQRSRRYSMLVRDRRIEKMFVEPDVEGDPYEVSDADTMLRYLDPEAHPDEVALLTRPGCPHCARAKEVLDAAGIDYAEISLEPRLRTRALAAICGAKTVPQFFVDGRHMGGSEAVEAYATNDRRPVTRPRASRA